MAISHSTSHVPRPTSHTLRPAWGFGLAWVFAILASLVLYAIALWFGEVNQDEGWYLYAGRLVSEGQRPFIDFASTQGPVMAYVYGLAQPLVRLWGVAGGRIFTAILGFATALCAALLAYRIAESTKIATRIGTTMGIDEDRDNDRDNDFNESSPSHSTISTCNDFNDSLSTSYIPLPTSHSPLSPSLLAALITFLLLSLNLYHVYFTSMVKTYSLAGLLVILGFLALEKALRSPPCHAVGLAKADPHSPPSTVHSLLPTSLVLSAFLAAACFALAAGVRLSAGILLPTIWLALLFRWARRGRSKQGLAILVGFLLGGSVVLLTIYVPFMIAAPQALKFGLLDYHGGRTVGSLVVVLAYKAGFLIRLAGAYFPLIALGLVSGVLSIIHRPPRSTTATCNDCNGPSPDISHSPPPTLHSPHSTSHVPRPTSHFLLSISLLMVTLVHLVAIFPYDDYQVFIMPLLAVVVAIRLLDVGRWTLDVGRSTPAEPISPTSATSATSCSNPRLSFQLLSLSLLFLLLLLLHSLSSPLLQNWLLAKRDRIWWPLRTESSLRTLQRAGKQVRELAGGESTRIGTKIETTIGIDEDRDKDRDKDVVPSPSALRPPTSDLSASPPPDPVSSVQRLQRETCVTNPPSVQRLQRETSVTNPPSVQRLQRATPATDPPSHSPQSTPHGPHLTLLTQDTYLAVEAGLRVPEGLELGPFSYFPDMDREKAQACHVLNREMLHEILASSDAPVAAFSGYGLAIRCPEITQLPIDEQTELWTMVESRYEQTDEVTPFGQADTTLRVFGRK